MSWKMKVLAINSWVLPCSPASAPVSTFLCLCVCCVSVCGRPFSYFRFYLFFSFSFLVRFIFSARRVFCFHSSKWPTSSLKWSIKKILQPIRFATVEWENKHKEQQQHSEHRHTRQTHENVPGHANELFSGHPQYFGWIKRIFVVPTNHEENNNINKKKRLSKNDRIIIW